MKRTPQLGLGPIAAVISIALLLTVGCGQQSSKVASSGASVSSAPEAAVSDTSRDATAEKHAAVPRRIIYSADISLATESLSEAARDIDSKVKQFGGYVADSELGGGDDKHRTGTWKVRIPAAQFDTFVKSLQGIGDVVNTKISSEDVSEEFYDVEARLRNKQAEEARLLQHLKSSTAHLSDILAVERELSRVREEIERIQGRLRFLTNQTDLTTVTITVRETGKGPVGGPTFISQISRTFSASLQAMGDFGRGLALLLIALLPWLLVFSGVGVPFYLRHRRNQRRRQTLAAHHVQPAERVKPEGMYEQ